LLSACLPFFALTAPDSARIPARQRCQLRVPRPKPRCRPAAEFRRLLKILLRAPRAAPTMSARPPASPAPSRQFSGPARQPLTFHVLLRASTQRACRQRRCRYRASARSSTFPRPRMRCLLYRRVRQTPNMSRGRRAMRRQRAWRGQAVVYERCRARARRACAQRLLMLRAARRGAVDAGGSPPLMRSAR